MSDAQAPRSLWPTAAIDGAVSTESRHIPTTSRLTAAQVCSLQYLAHAAAAAAATTTTTTKDLCVQLYG